MNKTTVYGVIFMFFQTSAAIGLPSQPISEPVLYVCTAQKAIGLLLNKETQEWEPSSLNVAGKQFFLKGSPNGEWTWTESGSATPLLGEMCSSPNEASFVICSGAEDIRVNLLGLRFQVIFAVGYIGTPVKIPGLPDFPFVEFGTCSVSHSPN